MLVDLLIACGSVRRFVGDPRARLLLDEAMALAKQHRRSGAFGALPFATGSDAWGLNAQFGLVDESVTAASPRRSYPGWETDHAELRVSAAARLACEYVYLDDPSKATALSARTLDEAETSGAVVPLAGALMARWVTIWSPESRRAPRPAQLASASRPRHDLDPTRLLLLRTTTALEEADGVGLAEVHLEMTELAATGRYPRSARSASGWARCAIWTGSSTSANNS
jgi:hypothetical protein